MRRVIFALVLMAAAALVPSRASAQVAAGFDDPFFLYYSYYVPQQAFFASVPRTEDTLRAMAVARQFNAITERGALSDPAALDPLAAFSNNGVSRLPKTVPVGLVSTHANGAGATGYYNRSYHFPGLRTGRAQAARSALPNPVQRLTPQINPLGTVQSRGGMGGMGGMGMGGMGGMGGFR
jgi:hypothetical protein